ncbi:MAG TPA: hypothetical protein EYG70_07710 [Sulfurimonas sp.]|nr:hypothetical protein [Sulfurimonas sp.]
MQISANLSSASASQNSSAIKTNFTEKISKQEATEIRAKITENANAFALKSFNIQGTLVSQKVNIEDEYADFQTFLSDIGYEGKQIASLSQEEAGTLVSEDGFFGIKQTSERIANFVIAGAGGDESMLRSGREGMLQGFKDAEAMWGGKLPDISQETMKKAVELVDKKMYDLGFSILNQEA